MTSVGAGGELDVSFSLFEYSHHGEVARNASDRFCDYSAALIADKKRSHAASFEFGYQLGTTVAGPFLRARG